MSRTHSRVFSTVAVQSVYKVSTEDDSVNSKVLTIPYDEDTVWIASSQPQVPSKRYCRNKLQID
jgi:hypothetical protein